MKPFKLLYEEALDALISEGGNAVPGVDRIRRDTIFRTVADFRARVLTPLFGYPPGDEMFLLGSTGKKPDSGDIDIGIDLNAMKCRSALLNLIRLNEICARAGFNSCINTVSYRMVHIAYPQIGEEPKKVQIDVLFTESPEFTKFYMSSPAPSESRYKGAHRNTLIRAILYCSSYRPLKADEAGQPVKWEQLDIQDNGIFMQTKTLVDENGRRLTYKDTGEPLEPPYAKVETELKVCDDVPAAIRMFAGDGVTEADVSTFERLFSLVRSGSRFSGMRREILTKCAEDLLLAEKRLEFPDELKAYVRRK